MKKILISGLLVFLFFASPGVIFSSAGHDENPAAVQENKPPELKKEIVKINYIEIIPALSILNQYKSRWGKIQGIRERNILIIEDTPEFVDKLMTILNEIDTKPLDLEFKVDLIMGAIRNIPKEEIDKELSSDPLIKELKNLLHFNVFERLDTSIIKVQDNSRSHQRMGGMGMSFQLELMPRYIKEDRTDSFQVEMSLTQDKGFTPEAKQRNVTLLATKLTLKSGERQVVGVSRLDGGDKALILILSGRIYK